MTRPVRHSASALVWLACIFPTAGGAQCVVDEPLDQVLIRLFGGAGVPEAVGVSVALSGEAMLDATYESDTDWWVTLPSPMTPDEIRLDSISGRSYRQIGPVALLPEDDEGCHGVVNALEDVALAMSREVTGGAVAGGAAVADGRAGAVVAVAGLGGLAGTLIASGRDDEAREAALEAYDQIDGLPNPRDPRLSDVEHDLAGTFDQLDDPVRSEALYRYSLAGRQDSIGYAAVLAERHGTDPGDLETLRPLIGLALVESMFGLAFVLEKQGRVADGAALRAQADEILNDIRGEWPIDPLPVDTVDGAWGQGVFELHGFVGMMNDMPEYTINDIDIIRRDATIGGRIGYITTANVFFEMHLQNSLIRVRVSGDDPGVQRNLNAWLGGGTAGLFFPLRREIQVFGTLGAEGVRFYPDGLDSETNFAWLFGFGGRFMLNPHIAIRVDSRWHRILDALQQTLGDVAPLAPENLTLWELSVGVSWLTGPGYPRRVEVTRER